MNKGGRYKQKGSWHDYEQKEQRRKMGLLYDHSKITMNLNTTPGVI